MNHSWCNLNIFGSGMFTNIATFEDAGGWRFPRHVPPEAVVGPPELEAWVCLLGHGWFHQLKG